MELSEKKSKILVNPKKSDLMKESIREMLRLEVQNLQEKAKKTLDPVGKEDKDIDNDGDHDKSDKYLLNGLVTTIPEHHTLVEMEEPDDQGNTHYVSHYDIVDKGGRIYENVAVEDLEVLVSEAHNH